RYLSALSLHDALPILLRRGAVVAQDDLQLVFSRQPARNRGDGVVASLAAFAEDVRLGVRIDAPGGEQRVGGRHERLARSAAQARSEEHTSELQSRFDL